MLVKMFREQVICVFLKAFYSKIYLTTYSSQEKIPYSSLTKQFGRKLSLYWFYEALKLIYYLF